MLIEKKLMTGDIVSVKLSNGDELIARYDGETTDSLTLNKPLAITFGSQGLGMIPWLFLANDDTFVLSKNHVMVVVKSKKDAADQYLQGTTGIALV
jgi:hypothetical protein